MSLLTDRCSINMKRILLSTSLILVATLTVISCSVATNHSENAEASEDHAEQNTSESNRTSPPSGGSENTRSNLFEFSSETVRGTSLSSDDLKGKVVMINYWGTWCPPCIKEIPHFQEVYEEHKEDGFTIIGIAIPRGSQGGQEDVLSFMDKKNMTYPVMMQDKAPNQKIQNRYSRIRVVPTSFILNRNGEHVETIKGYTEKKTLIDTITTLLKKDGQADQ